MKETTMRQAHLGRYLGFQAYLLAFIQRLENMIYKEVLLIRKVFQNQQEYATFRQCGQKEIHAKSEKTQLRIWPIFLLCAGLRSYRVFLRTGSKSLCFSLLCCIPVLAVATTSMAAPERCPWRRWTSCCSSPTWIPKTVYGG